jgi:ligand-binding sensor domain-containing protein/DNA-binding CsgD family transcriptional regulator
VFCQSANIGTPPTINFTKSVYKGGTQTWDIAQDASGITWYANNGGLLEYDGKHWRSYPISNQTIVRSVAVDNQSKKVYIGGQGELGYFLPDAFGRMEYHSLSAMIPSEEQHFGDIWDIVIVSQGVFFRTNKQVFWLKDNKITALFGNNAQLLFMGNFKDNILVQNSNFELFTLKNGRIEAFGSNIFCQISSILPYTNDTTLVTTIKNGIFAYSNAIFQSWRTSEDAFLQKNIIFCAESLPDGKIAIGTALNGLVTIDKSRRVFHHINKKNGLQNNTILSLRVSSRGGVWLGTDNGIDYADIDSPFTTLYPDDDLQGTGYSAAIYHGKIYFGTNTGLYATDWKSYYSPLHRTKIDLVHHSEGQVWGLTHLGEKLLMGHHEGAFQIEGYEAKKIAPLQGVWKFLSINDDYAVAGFYAGLALFKRSGYDWFFDSVFDQFSESSRIIAKDAEGNIWMAHPYRGIFKLKIDLKQKSIQNTFYAGQNGLPAGVGNHLFSINNKILYTAKKGIFDYDAAKDLFSPNLDFDAFFGKNSTVKYLKEDEKGNIWYVADKVVGKLQVEDKALEKKVVNIPIPELEGKLTDGFQFVLPIDDYNVFLATEKGFLHFNPSIYQSKEGEMRLLLNEVSLLSDKDSVIYVGHQDINEIKSHEIHLKSNENNLRFSFAAPDYPENEFVKYSHFLEGKESSWSEWKKEASLSFNNLSPGKYTFHVKSKNQYGNESKVISFTFVIVAPWYATTMAYCFYGLCLFGGFFALMKRQQQQFEEEKQTLEQLHQEKEAEHLYKVTLSEESINRLQQENLEAELRYKNQELVSVTMHIAQKNEILNTIRLALQKLEKEVSKESKIQQEVAQIVKMMQNDDNIDADWEHFVRNFDQVHNDFFKRLKDEFPLLSPNDYKLCAYLRMNLSSKEIAALLNISIRSVETSRYRLRKKIELSNDTNLTDFLMQY